MGKHIWVDKKKKKAEIFNKDIIQFKSCFSNHSIPSSSKANVERVNVFPSQRTCFLDLFEAHAMTTAALTEAVGVSEGMQGGNRRQIRTQAEPPTQQPQSD